MRQLLRYSAGLIALYIVVHNGTNSGKLFKEGSTGAALVAKTFQGR